MRLSFSRDQFFQTIFHLSPEELLNDGLVKQKVVSYFNNLGFDAEVAVLTSQIDVTLNTDLSNQADREVEKIADFASKGNYEKALKEIEDALVKFPAVSELYRIKGQILSDKGDTEGGVNVLIDALRLDPENKWALIMMGNIYARNRNDVKTGRIYYEKALEVDPKDNIAMSNIGAVLLECEQFEEGFLYLKKALKLNDTYPNTYLGLSLGNQRKGNNNLAFDWAIKGLKKTKDKSRVGQMLIGIAIESAEVLVKENDGIKTVYGYLAKLEEESKKTIEVEKSDEIPFAAKLEIAENKNRDYHLIRYKPNHFAVAHLILHELVHLQFVIDARKVSRNELFVTRPGHEVKFRSRLGKYISKLTKLGYPLENINSIISQLFSGLNAQVYNTPIDQFIELYIFENFKQLRPHQFISLLQMTQEGIKAVTSKEIIELSDPWILECSKTYNLINAMGLRELYGVDFADLHNPTSSQLKKAEKAFNEFLGYSKNKEPGEEYDLVNNWADDFGLLPFFELLDEKEYRQKKADPITPLDTGIGVFESTKDETYIDEQMSIFRKKHEGKGLNMPVVMFMIEAIKALKAKSNDETKGIAFQIAQIGMSGISPEKEGYHVPLLPGSNFSGYQMLAYYYVSWAIAIPEMLDKLQLPFDKEYTTAQQMFK